MPATRLTIGRFRSPLLRRPVMLGVAGGAVALLALGLAAWARLAPGERFPDPSPSAVEPIPALASFGRPPADDSALAVIAGRNVLAVDRRDFTREVAQADEPEPVDPGASDREKRIENAKRDLQTLRLVAILRLQEDWVALFEPAVRKAEEDLLSLRVGDTWRGWEIASIKRDSVNLGFEGHTEQVDLKPNTGRTTRKSEPRGRLIVESRPAQGRRVTIEAPITRSEARERLLGAAREEDPRVRKLAEDLLKELDRENDG